MSKTQKSTTIPVYMKYANTVSQNWLDPLSKLKPSDLVKPSIDVSIDDYPMIIEFNNMSDNTSNVHSTVDIDQPLFQPAPKIVVFEEYKPFTVIEKKLYFRNKDSVTRRIKIVKPDTNFFELSAPKSMNGEPLLQTKIASGMEIYFVVTFKPQEVRDYSYDLICSTEREKFIVPIRAVGTRPHLTFPDEIDFGSFPIKSPSQRKLSVQNIGNAVAKFNMRSSNPLFSCPTQDIAIEPGASDSIEFYFTPSDTEPAEGEIQIDFLKSVTCYIRLTGIGRNADVSLSTPSLNLEPSYISLLSQKSLRIKNNSDTPISYMWKSFSSERDEDSERSRLQQEINRMEDLEQSALRQRIQDGYYSSTVAADDYYIEDNPSMYGSILGDNVDELNPIARMNVPLAAKSDQASLVRKYRNLRKALEKDNMQFVDDIFEITPIEGQVWAHSEIEISVCFRPDTAALYNCLAYLDVSGREDRLPLQLSGQGIGPNATLSFEVLDIGDVFINDQKNYDLKIKNRGDIPAQWTFMSSLTKFGNKFKFSPTEGYLKPGQSQNIAIQFQSDLLGEFSEHFRFALQGNEDMLVAQIKGHVIGPHFHFDVTTIDFGTVSYDYLHTTTVTLVNTSSIPMDYSLHVPQDGLSFLKKEFNITPSNGKLVPGDSFEVLIEFIPSSVKIYNYSLSVDVLGVGDNLLSLPIIAECVVSSVKLELPSREIDFGDCFIRYPYEKTLLLTNLSHVVHTKFEIMPQLKQTKSVASFYTVPSVAVIEPGDSIEIKVCLTTLKLGSFKLPMTIVVAGSKEPPMQAVLQYNTVGPRVVVDVTELRWGNIECLKDSDRTIKLTNTGLTTAVLKLFLKMARSNFSLATLEIVLDAAESYDLVVTANLDDCVVCKDEMHVVIEEGDNLMVPLIAKGIGTTMYCKQDVDILDLGVQLTNNYIEKQIILENKGRRPQQLKWYNRTIRTENSARMTKAKKEGKDTTQPKRLPKHLMPLEPMFTITPEEIILRSRTATTFTIKCYSNIPRSINEIFVLESKVGKDRYMKEIMITDVRCDIVNPLLEFSYPSLDFNFTWLRGIAPVIQKKEITLTNNSTLVLAFYLKTEIPFNLNTWEAVLQPGQKIDVEVDFDPVYKDNKQSHTVEKTLSIHYRNHPQKDAIPMKAELIYPNLAFDQSAIQFGCVLNDTTKTMKLKATNSSKISLNYEWVFTESAAPKVKSRGSVIAIAPSQVFDILPVRSMLDAGESEDVEFTLYGNANTKFSGSVICIVEGGPEYSFPISGEASTVSFELNRSIIDFGKVVFTEKAEEELEIINNGKVPFNYKINPTTNNGAQLLQVLTPIGKVPPGQNVKVVIRVLPGVPTSFFESLSVSIAHFDVFLLPCYCQGIFPSAVVSLPRYRKFGPYGESENVNSEMWSNFYNLALKNIIAPDPSLLPPVVLPTAVSGNTALPPVYELSSYLPPCPPTEEDDNVGGDNASLDGGSILPASISSINTKGVSQILIEMEMQKLVLVNQLQKLVSNIRTDTFHIDQSIILEPDYDINSPRFGMQALVSKNIKITEIVAANYICDFGYVIVGQTRKKIIKITNASFNGKLNWFFDKKYLSGTGFTIEPEHVTKMLEGATLDFTIKFFARPNISIGQKIITLPIESVGSPAINIILNAMVCIPEVELSSTNIEFGRLLIGRCMQMYISLYNPTPVTANWQFRKGGKDDNKFKIEPSSASLRPGKRMLVCLEFAPTDPHKYSMEVTMKVDQNKKNKIFNVIGEGFGTPLKFEPQAVELGPILPYANGDEKIITINNASEVDVEFYSVDFDTLYHEEENKLTQITSYDEQGLFRTSLRLPGNPLPIEIQELYNQLQNNQDTLKTNDVVGNEENISPRNAIEENTIVLENAPIRTTAGPRDENLHQDIILFGPPISGISSHAIQMSKKLVIPIKTIDQIIDEIAMTNDPLYGYLARSSLNKLQSQELQEYKTKEEELLAIADQSKATAEEAYKKANKKAKEVPAEVYLTPEVLAHKDFVNSRCINTNTISELVKFRMSWIDMDRGVIIDGVMSKYIEPETILNSIEIALPFAIISHISINRNEEGYIAWLSSLYNSKNDESNRLKRLIESNKKIYKKLCKASKKKISDNATTILASIDQGESLTLRTTGTTTLENTIQLNKIEDDFPIVIPEGDEIWINQATGLVIELEQNDFKALEELDKFKYLEQLFYQYSNQIQQMEKLKLSILRIWNPESGLRTKSDTTDVDNKITEVIPNGDNIDTIVPDVVPEDCSDIVYYNDYVEKVLSVIGKLKVGTYGMITTKEEILEENKEETLVNEVEVVSEDLLEKPVINNGGLYTIQIDGDESENAVFTNINAILPPPLLAPPDKDAVPPPLTFQVYRKPLQRHHRKPIKLFKILPMEESATTDTSLVNNYRWIIPANSSIQFRVKFACITESKPESTMEFEVVGTNQKFSLYCKGICELPKINSDSRNIFMRRVKGLNPNPGASLPLKRFVIAENFYSFGPLCLFKKPEWKKSTENELSEADKLLMQQIESTNMDILRFTNNGLYKCNIDFGFLTKNEGSRDIFNIEPNKLELEEGETKEIKLWALPKEIKEYNNDLVINLTNNPMPMVFPIKCWGVEPTIEFTGPWSEGLEKAEKALAANTDKKLTKDLELKLTSLKEALTIDFDRILIKKSDTRSFTIKNTSLLPIQWEIDLGDFKNSDNISVMPMSGVIPINTTEPILINFTSPDPLMLTGNFSLRYSDNEGGLKAEPSRAITTTFRCIAEAFKIIAVSLNSLGKEEGGSEIDFGLMRVGDNAVQTMKMGNKGKYQIAYEFKLTTALINSLVRIEPLEGLIEAGTALAEIKVFYCCKDSELVLKNNKDIVVHIIEPITKEVVEKFPLLISAQSKYSKFRLQPSKGISFGAVRFDSEAKVKRVELRNEGNFELTYVICAAQAEIDEIDSLDPAAYACYAQATPQAMRAIELGSNYFERINGTAGGAPVKGGKGKEKPPPAKGKGGPVPPPSAAQLNPLVIDPDELPPGAALPDNPLTVGAFTVLPRIGTVQPGQSVGIDMKFDPSGCDTVKERLRLCISGADPKDSLSQVIKSFEVTGESCVPAIITDDIYSIFEEQEIVHSLADSTGDKSSEGGGKIEKLPVGKVVYAETEKMLAFGPISCNSQSRGVIERVRISNPTKIDIKVKFNILSAEEAAAGPASANAKGKAPPPAKGGKGAPVAPVSDKPTVFTVQPEKWEIPPHEHRFVNIYFNPTEIKSYRSVFKAMIDDGGVETSAVSKTPNSGKTLTFELAGSGTLPCIAFDQPTEFNSEGNLQINFSKVLTNRSVKRKLILRNDGVMPTTCLFDMIGDEDFVFPSKGTSLIVNPGGKETIWVSFVPKEVVGDGNRKAAIKVSVLNNPFDQYTVQLLGFSYSCDAMIKTNFNEATLDGEDEIQNDIVRFADINLAHGEGKSSQTILISSQSNEPVKFELKCGANVPDVLKFSPSTGHLGAHGSREITITFTTSKPISLNKSAVNCVLQRIQYASEVEDESKALWGSWDDAMKSKRDATPEDIVIINKAAKDLEEFNKNVAAELAKGKKGKPVGAPPPKCLLELVPMEHEDGIQTVFEIVTEPKFEFVSNAPEQELALICNGTADVAKFKCKNHGENITFNPTFLFQATAYNFEFTNESNIKIPIKWSFEDMKRRAVTRQSGILARIGTAAANLPVHNIPCPYSIEPEEYEVEPNATKQFTMKFSPVEVDDFMYMLKGTTISTSIESAGKEYLEMPPSEVRMIVRGSAKRPICHFDIVETLDYMSRRPLNMKNENGLNSPIEVTDIKLAELESIGLQTRNTFRFYITNPTNDNYEFIWEALGEASPFWRCVQGAGMMFAGKRIEVVFEYLPEEVNVAEAFFKFRIPKVGLEQIFLFTGKVVEPKVFFSTSKIDFHSVMLGGEGSNDTIYLENHEHLPFYFAIDKYSLLQLDGPKRPILEISPKEGTVPPNGKIAMNLFFHPQEEVLYNFNIVCGVKRKPNKLTLNIKGEGYVVHPFIQLEQTQEMAEAAGAAKGGVVNRYITLRPAPAINYADFGAVQVHDTITKTLTVTNNGKFNFDYIWDIDAISPMLILAGGKMGGTLLKAEQLTYKITFAPNREGSLDGSLLCFTVAGKYAYNIIPRGSGVKPALRFSFMQHNFGACFVTSPGGSTVIEETVLRITNHDPLSNIAIECTFQKTRALWAECPPTVIVPGGVLDVPIRFAPREVKDYAFVIPFIVNGSSKIPVNIIGSGINARLELVNGSQRRTNFGLVDVDSSSSRTIAIINKSKKALPVQLAEEGEYGSGNLYDHCIAFSPKGEFVIGPKETVSIQLTFNPTKRISQFSEDLLVRYSGISKTLLNISGKSQGNEISLDSDSLPFGTVVLDSQKIKKLSLENTGDLTITFQWVSSTFGQHFSISPLSGKILPGGEISFDVIFKPKFADDDIRQDNMMLIIPGLDPLKLTCTGSCIIPPSENVITLEFKSLARKAQEKSVKIQNPTDKDWYLSPSLQGDDWKIPHEFKVPAKGTADLPVTYYPLTMLNASTTTSEEKSHKGQLFIALPDGSAQLYKLKGEADAPECAGQFTIETPAKKAAIIILKVNNWLNDTQRFDVSVNIGDKPTPATFIVAANFTEIASNGTKEFPLRFISYTEGNSKGRITFTNPVTKEYCFYEINAKTIMPEIQENIFIESPVRQTARSIISIENPLLKEQIPIAMGSIAKPSEWWTCDCPYIKVNELSPLNGNIEGTFEVEYRPLKPTAQPTEYLLAIITKELGTFKYKVTVKATPPLLKQVLRFDASLGSMQAESFIFRSYNTTKCDYLCSLKKPEYFQVQNKLEVGPVQGGWNGDDIRLNVVFEPSIIGEIRDTLVVTSVDGGEYICEVIGNCTAPMPQGPFNLIQGVSGSIDIPFRNCFSSSATWSFSIDSNAFRITAPNSIATVNAKTQSQCSIIFEPKEQHLALYPKGGSMNAKLFITCTSIPNIPPWIFYLKGQIDLNIPLAGAGGTKKK